MTLREDWTSLPPILILTAGGLENGGGIGRMIGYLTEQWCRAGAAPAFQVLDTRGPGAWRRWPRNFGRAATVLWRASRRREIGPPLAYIHVAGRGSTLRKLLLVAIARACALPVVLHLHDYDYEAFCRTLPSAGLGLVRWMFGAADHVIVLGEDARQTVTGLLHVPAERVTILPNAVPAPTETADRPARSRGDGSPHILFLGQLSERKGTHDLIAALDHPRMRALGWRATIAGGGPHEARFAGQLAATGVADRVAMPGWVDRRAAAALLADADILVLPSYGEGMAMSILEAMSFGLAIVATPVGALREVLEPNRTALLVKPGDVSALAGALARVVADADLRQRLSSAALARFAADFDVAQYPRRLLPIMIKALEQKRARLPVGPDAALSARQTHEG